MKIRRIYSCAPGGPSRATGEIASRVRLEFQNAVEGGFRGESLWVERQPGVFTAVYCGQLAERKGVHLIVQAARRLLMEGKKLRVLLAGDYSYRNDFAQDLVARVAKDGLTDSICFLGFVRNPRDLLTVCDLHLCPSLWNEPLGNTVLEAKEAAIPSIIFPVGGLAETVSHGVDGWVCKSPTPEDLEEALRFYLEQPEQCRQQGMEARKNLELRFGSERFRKEWTEVFQTTAPTHKIRGRMVISPSNA